MRKIEENRERSRFNLIGKRVLAGFEANPAICELKTSHSRRLTVNASHAGDGAL
jgi:hypothetical protein